MGPILCPVVLRRTSFNLCQLKVKIFAISTTQTVGTSNLLFQDMSSLSTSTIIQIEYLRVPDLPMTVTFLCTLAEPDLPSFENRKRACRKCLSIWYSDTVRDLQSHLMVISISYCVFRRNDNNNNNNNNNNYNNNNLPQEINISAAIFRCDFLLRRVIKGENKALSHKMKCCTRISSPIDANQLLTHHSPFGPLCQVDE